MLRKLLLILVFSSGSCFADINTGGLYLGAGIGAGSSGMLGNLTIGEMFNRYIGIEGNYTFWGSNNVASPIAINNQQYNINYTQNPQALNGQLYLNLPLGASPISVHAKIGMAYVFLNGGNASVNNFSVTPTGAGFTSVGGIGAGLNIGRRVQVDLDWVNYGFIQPLGINTNSINVGSWSSNNAILSVNYHF